VINTNVLQPLFDSFAALWTRKVSEHSGIQAQAGPPASNIVSFSQVTENLTDRCVLAATVFNRPVPGISMLFLPLPESAAIPERIVNPDSEIVPDTLTDLHRSALKELADSVWKEAAGKFTSAASAEFEVGETEISVDSPSNFIRNMPGLADIKQFLALQYPLEIRGESTAMLQLFPADFILKSMPEAAAEPALSKESAAAKKGAGEAGRTKPPKKLEAMEVPRVTPDQVKVKPTGGAKFDRKLPPEEIAKRNIATLMDVTVELKAELGRNEMPAGEIAAIGPGSLVELDSSPTQPIGIYASGKLIARGRVVAVGDNFGVQITEMVGPQTRAMQE